MKNLVLIIMAVCFGAFTTQAETTFDVRLSEVSNDGNTYVTKIEMRMFGDNPSDFKLGSTSVQFKFPNEALSHPQILSHVFENSFFYIEPTVTQPFPGEVSFNIELAIPNMGITIPTGDEWITLGEISFTIDDMAKFVTPTLLYTGGSTKTVVFLDDESTQIYKGIGVDTPLGSSSSLEIEAYPNPNTGEAITVELIGNNTKQKMVIEISEMTGRVVYSSEDIQVENSTLKKVNFDQQLTSGVYSINILMENKTLVKTFVVE